MQASRPLPSPPLHQVNQKARLALDPEDSSFSFSAPIDEEDQSQQRGIFTQDPHTDQYRSRQNPRICTEQGAMDVCIHVRLL